MPKSYYGYDPYRGRSGAKTVLTALVIILLVLLLLAVAFFFFAQPYIVYGDDGKAHLEFSFLQGESTPSPEPSHPVVILVTPSPTPEPTPQPGPVLVELPLTALTDGTAQEQVDVLGGDGAVFTMKAESGALGYVSQLNMAVNSGVNPKEKDLNEAIAAFNQGGLYTVARVVCFKDDAVPYQYGQWAGLRTSKGNWRDADGSRWLSPAADRARDYITGVCLELAKLGFDEIWLDRCAFPTEGDLDRIVRGDAYNDDALQEDLAEFYAQVSGALAQDYPQVTLSFTAEKGVLLSDAGDLSGQTAQLLAQYAQKLYLPSPQPEEDWSAALEAIGLSEDKLVYLSGDDIPAQFGRLLTP